MDAQRNRDSAKRREKTKVAVPAAVDLVAEKRSSHLPMDIVYDILLRLPVKSLLRCQAVCKSWFSLISDPQFVKSQVSLANKGANVNYIHFPQVRNYFHADEYQSRPPVFCTSITNSIASKIGEVEMDYYPFRCRPNAVLGSCNGLLLITTNQETFLWNPSTRQSRKTMPSGNIWEKYPCMDLVSGLGYDSLLDDYKAVILVFDRFSDYKFFRGQPPMFIFSSRMGYWKEVDGYHDLHCIMHDTCYPCIRDYRGLTVNGAPHWMVYDCNDKYSTINYFDMVDEKFKRFPASKMFECAHCFMCIWQGCLSILHKNLRGECTEFWVMKEYGVAESWTKLIIIPQCSPWSLIMPLAFTKNGDEVVLVIGLIGSKLALKYNFKTNQEKYDSSKKNFSMSVASVYVESLVSPWFNWEHGDKQRKIKKIWRRVFQ